MVLFDFVQTKNLFQRFSFSGKTIAHKFYRNTFLLTIYLILFYTASKSHFYNKINQGHDCEEVTERRFSAPTRPQENCRMVQGSRERPRIRANSRRLNERSNRRNLSRDRPGFLPLSKAGYRQTDRFLRDSSVPVKAATREGAANRGGTASIFALLQQAGGLFLFSFPIKHAR